MSAETIPAVPTIEYYYDSHLTEEDLMGESTSQDLPVRYLIELLRWLFRSQSCFIPRNLQIYRTENPLEKPISPDIAVFKGFVLPDPLKEDIKSWRVGSPGRFAPNVVIELASTKTQFNDLAEKPGKYALMGASEYYSYDARPESEAGTPRLRGWYPQDGLPCEMNYDKRGWLFSGELESWLVPDGAYLRLYDRSLNQRLTGEEAERAEKEKE